MCVELRLRGIAFERQKCIAVQYKGLPVGEARLDLLVEGCLLVELKAVDAIGGIHKAQVLSYLQATNLELGLLINFNVTVLHDGVKRIARSKRLMDEIM